MRAGFLTNLGVWWRGVGHFLIPPASVSFFRHPPASVLGRAGAPTFVWMATWEGRSEKPNMAGCDFGLIYAFSRAALVVFLIPSAPVGLRLLPLWVVSDSPTCVWRIRWGVISRNATSQWGFRGNLILF